MGKKKGWPRESQRHGMSARGIRTAKGKIRVTRPPHTRTLPTGEKIRVKETTYLTEDKGEPGKTPPEKQWFRGIGSLQGWEKTDPYAKRQAALRATIKAEGGGHKGWLTTMRRLQALENVTADPETKRKAGKDIDYLYRNKTRLEGGIRRTPWRKFAGKMYGPGSVEYSESAAMEAKTRLKKKGNLVRVIKSGTGKNIRYYIYVHAPKKSANPCPPRRK